MTGWKMQTQPGSHYPVYESALTGTQCYSHSQTVPERERHEMESLCPELLHLNSPQKENGQETAEECPGLLFGLQTQFGTELIALIFHWILRTLILVPLFSPTP